MSGLFNGPLNPHQKGHDGGYHYLSFCTSPLGPFDLGNYARNL
jgi:hypothetical protein